jgi:hypothetical protein
LPELQPPRGISRLAVFPQLTHPPGAEIDSFLAGDCLFDDLRRAIADCPGYMVVSTVANAGLTVDLLFQNRLRPRGAWRNWRFPGTSST